jgi:hypothetical protein
MALEHRLDGSKCTRIYPRSTASHQMNLHFMLSRYTSLPTSAMSKAYPSIPTDNVTKIINGWLDQMNGTLCTPTQ